MSILVDKKTRALIQGITGNEGSRACREMLAYGTQVLAGVTPGKGGQTIEGVPVYNSVREAMQQHPKINVSLIAVPAPFAKSAAIEAIESGIQLVNILTEHVPVQDCAILFASAKQHGARVVGPSSVGIISPGKGKVGSIGSGGVSNVFTPGRVGIISKSGGMTSEVAVILTRAGIGQSTALGIGGDQIVGSDFVDILELFERDPETRATVIFGEVGGTYEERIADFVKAGKLKKPVVAIIAGKFTTTLPEGVALGHAGAIVSRGRGGYESKVKALKAAGVLLARTLEEIPLLLKRKFRGKL